MFLGFKRVELCVCLREAASVFVCTQVLTQRAYPKNPRARLRIVHVFRFICTQIYIIRYTGICKSEHKPNKHALHTITTTKTSQQQEINKYTDRKLGFGNG